MWSQQENIGQPDHKEDDEMKDEQIIWLQIIYEVFCAWLESYSIGKSWNFGQDGKHDRCKREVTAQIINPIPE